MAGGHNAEQLVRQSRVKLLAAFIFDKAEFLMCWAAANNHLTPM